MTQHKKPSHSTHAAAHDEVEAPEPAPVEVSAAELDQLADDIAEHLHTLPPAYAALGGTGGPPALPEAKALAAQIRPHLTPEVVQSGLFGKGGKFNPTEFIKNVNGLLPLITTLIGLFGGPKLPPITIPVPTPPTT